VVVLKPQKWRRQPTGAVEINRSHWAANALIHAYIPRGLNSVDANTKYLWTPTGSVGITSSPFGRSFNGAVSTYVSIPSLPINSPTKIVIVARVNHSTAGSNDGFIVNKNFSSTVPYSLCTRYAGSTTVQGMGFYDGSAWRTSGITTDIGGTGWRDVGGSYDGSNNTYYVDRKVDAQVAFSGTLPSNSSALDIGTYRSDGKYFTGFIEYVYLFDGSKLNGNVQVVSELQKEPYSLFVPIRKRIYVNSVAGAPSQIASSFFVMP
jgi:hypothetical protein